MNEREFHDRCNEIVINKETRDFNILMDKYEFAQKREDDCQLNILINKIYKERKRLDPKDKYDEEEVQIARMVRSKR